MREGASLRAPISPAEVEAELQRILAAPTFRRAPRHSRFLEFVVRKKLAGSPDCIKEYSIGVEVFDRPADYDPGAEPVVRVEAGRLRSRLAEYYETSGKLDELRIYLPRGTYVPIFSRNGFESPVMAPEVPLEGNKSVAAGLGVGSTEIPGSQQPPTPARRKTTAILGVMVGVGIAAFFLIRTLTADTRPQAARLEGSTLVVTNAKGEELWRKSFSEGFQRDSYEQGLATRMWFGDLEGKGRNSVLLLYNPAVNPRSHSTTLICYSDRGKEKWRWTPGRALPELEGDPAVFYTVGFGVLKGRLGEGSRIVVSSLHNLLYPHQIAVLDSNGKTLSEYWHSGHLDYLTLADLDGDGRQEIVASGISNGYRQATLVVLDPDRVFGASTEGARPEIQIHGMGVAQERLRLLFPRSDLNKQLSVYNQSEEVVVSNGRTRLAVRECFQLPSCRIWYEFDRSFNLTSVQVDDQFRSAHAEFYLRNPPHHNFALEEETEFSKVRCLVGCKTDFVPSPNLTLE